MGNLIPIGHKIAVSAISSGHKIIKFGHIIGIAIQDIAVGEHVHVHNVAPPDDTLIRQENWHESTRVVVDTSGLPKVFKGYKRKNGAAGIRNYVTVVAPVNCSATVVKAICRSFIDSPVLFQLGVDGVIPVTYGGGCALAVAGEYHNLLSRTLAGWIYHPNVVGSVVIGLGCEGVLFEDLMKHRDLRYPSDAIPIEHFNIQDEGGTASSIKKGILCVENVLSKLGHFTRESVAVSNLRVALNCGGSDAFSSITANPSLGIASDYLVALGGTVALAEIPECHGTEGLLYSRASSDHVRTKLDHVFNWWKNYAGRQNVTLNNNLAPGNISGGITTIVEKSLGAVTKAGTSLLNDVLSYGEPITNPGFVLMNTPGLDPVSVTGLVAGGCNLVAFTTGRGSTFGCGISPTIKIATNSAVYAKLKGDMDINAAQALEGSDVPSVGVEIFKSFIQVAEGRKTKSEELGLGWEEFVPWPLGETL